MYLNYQSYSLVFFIRLFLWRCFSLLIIYLLCFSCVVFVFLAISFLPLRFLVTTSFYALRKNDHKKLESHININIAHIPTTLICTNVSIFLIKVLLVQTLLIFVQNKHQGKCLKFITSCFSWKILSASECCWYLVICSSYQYMMKLSQNKSNLKERKITY